MSGRMLLLVVLALVIQVFGATTPYWTEAFVVEDSPSTGRGEKAGIEAGDKRLTLKSFDGIVHNTLIPCGRLAPKTAKPKYPEKETKGCRAKFLCDKTDTPEVANPYSTCLLNGNAVSYCDARKLDRFRECDQDDLQGLGQKQTKQIVIDYKSQVNHIQGKEIAVSMIFLGKPAALTVKARRLDPTKKVDGAEFISCAALVAKTVGSHEPLEGDCSVDLSCDGKETYRTCRLAKDDNRIHHCGNAEVTGPLTPCPPERLSQTNDALDTHDRYKTMLVGRDRYAMVSLKVRHEGNRPPRIRRVFSADLHDRVETIIPCSELYTGFAELAPALIASSGGLDEPCYVRLSCAGEPDDYTCRIGNRRSMDLSNCGPDREQGLLPECSDEFLRLKDDDDC